MSDKLAQDIVSEEILDSIDDGNRSAIRSNRLRDILMIAAFIAVLGTSGTAAVVSGVNNSRVAGLTDDMNVVRTAFTTDSVNGGSIYDRLDTIDAYLAELQSTLDQNYRDLQSLQTEFDESKETTNSVSEKLVDLSEQIDAIRQAIADLELKVENNSDTTENILTELGDIITDVENIQTQIETFKNEINTKIEEINTKLTKIDGDISTINNNVNTINTNVTNIDTKFTAEFTTVKNQLDKIYNDITTVLDQHFSEIETVLNTMKTDITRMFSEQTELINNAFNQQNVMLNTLSSQINSKLDTELSIMAGEVSSLLAKIDTEVMNLAIQIASVGTVVDGGDGFKYAGITVGGYADALAQFNQGSLVQQELLNSILEKMGELADSMTEVSTLQNEITQLQSGLARVELDSTMATTISREYIDSYISGQYQSLLGGYLDEGEEWSDAVQAKYANYRRAFVAMGTVDTVDADGNPTTAFDPTEVTLAKVQDAEANGIGGVSADDLVGLETFFTGKLGGTPNNVASFVGIFDSIEASNTEYEEALADVIAIINDLNNAIANGTDPDEAYAVAETAVAGLSPLGQQLYEYYYATAKEQQIRELQERVTELTTRLEALENQLSCQHVDANADNVCDLCGLSLVPSTSGNSGYTNTPNDGHTHTGGDLLTTSRDGTTVSYHVCELCGSAYDVNIVTTPGTGGTDPGTGGTDPGTSGTGGTDPGTGGTGGTDPVTGGTDPGTGGTGGTDPGTGGTDPGTGGTDPGTGGTDPGTGSTDPGTGSTDPGTGTP